MPCRVSEQAMSVVDESSVGVSIPSAAIGSLSDALPVNEGGGDAEATTPVVVVEELPEETPAEPYYWEEGGNPNVDWWSKVRHAMHFGSIKAIAGAEAVGEVVANTLGLNESKYQYVIDALEADELRRQREEQDEEDRRQMELRDQERHMDQGAVEMGTACVTQPSDVEAHGGGVGGSSVVANAPMDQQI